MLVVSRKKDEAVIIYSRTDRFEPIRVLVARHSGLKVRLGFDGNDDVVFLREELYEEQFGRFEVKPTAATA